MMIPQKWIAADGTPIPEDKFYDGLPIWSFTENLKNKKVLLKPSVLEPRAVEGTVRVFRLHLVDEVSRLLGYDAVDVYEDQDLVTLSAGGFEFKSASDLQTWDAIVQKTDSLYKKKQHLFLNAEVATIIKVEPLGPKEVCRYAPVAKTFVAHKFLGRFNG